MNVTKKLVMLLLVLGMFCLFTQGAWAQKGKYDDAVANYVREPYLIYAIFETPGIKPGWY